MNSWLEFSRLLPLLMFGALVCFVLALFLFDGLRSLGCGIRSWFAEKTPEDEAVDAISRYQGAFHLNEPGVVRQRFAHRYELTIRTHWACEGKWKADL